MAKPYLLQQLENNDSIFYAIINETTYEEILNAYNSGKSIFCKIKEGDNEAIIPLILTTSSQTYGFTFGYFFPFGITPKISFTCNPDSTWSVSSSSDIQGFDTLDPCTSTSTNIPISSSTKYFRPILISTSEPTSNDGSIGDIWIKYST